MTLLVEPTGLSRAAAAYDRLFERLLGTAAAPAVASAPTARDDAALRAELGKFIQAFGPVNGAKWFQEGLSYAAAQDRHLKLLTEENRRLAQQVAAATPAAPAAEEQLALRTGSRSLAQTAAGITRQNPTVCKS